MRHDKLERELRLMLLLTENRSYTIAQLCDRLQLSRRNVYYYLDFFRQSGFIVEKSGSCYRLNRHSPFFTHLFETVQFTENEAVLMRRLLEQTGETSPHVRSLRQKLDRFYDFHILNEMEQKTDMAHNLSRLYEAMKCKQVAVLKGYSSPNSNTKRDRLVEPFSFMNNNMEIRCYEIASSCCKTFKLARIDSVEVIDSPWIHEDRHRQLFTDLFMFSGEELMPVSLRLGRLANNLLAEEYPQASPHIRQEDENHWLFETNVCSYLGVTRFVLGLYEDIEVLGDKRFSRHISEKISQMARREKGQ